MPQTDLPQTEEFVRSSSSESSGSLEHHQSNLSISSASSHDSASGIIRYAELPVFEPLTFPREPSLDELLV